MKLFRKNAEEIPIVQMQVNMPDDTGLVPVSSEDLSRVREPFATCRITVLDNSHCIWADAERDGRNEMRGAVCAERNICTQCQEIWARLSALERHFGFGRGVLFLVFSRMADLLFAPL